MGDIKKRLLMMQGKNWEEIKMQATLSVRMHMEDYDFIKKMANENKEEMSKAIRELVDLGRMMYAIKMYKKGKASIGKAAELAGISISELIDILGEYGIKSKIDYDDYLKGLENLRRIW